ncbi:MAG: butyrate kinase [Muribaculaceae bacterium]|jgi:butyrate kinase|nr:butyrate kinase [Muribaculaceae bacterium]
MRILVINPGSTSTKTAVFDDEKAVMVKNIHHSPEELKQFPNIPDQFDFRKQNILKELEAMNIPIKFDAIISRGPLTKPMKGGVYEVNDVMEDDIRKSLHHHATDLGCVIARQIAATIPGCRSFIADPAVVDELNDYARISGLPQLKRISIWHALNQRAIARRFAREHGKKYEDYNLIICHLGGGISVAAHDHGRAVDTNNCLDGEGPFSPERAGSLPAGDLVRMCFSGKYTQEQVLKMLAGKGGLTAHLNTNNFLEIETKMHEGDEHFKLIVDAMVYHVAKAIAAEGAVLCGKVDAVIFTGGMARSKYLIDELTKRVGYLAPTFNYPGEDEMEALAENALMVLRGEVEPEPYV